MDNALLILNAGSSSLKFAVYQADAAGSLQAGYRGVVEAIGRNGRLRIFQAPDAGGQSDQAVADHPQALHRVVMDCAGDIPSKEALAATVLLREHFPELKVRFLNVVNLYKLAPAGEHPHALSNRDTPSA